MEDLARQYPSLVLPNGESWNEVVSKLSEPMTAAEATAAADRSEQSSSAAHYFPEDPADEQSAPPPLNDAGEEIPLQSSTVPAPGATSEPAPELAATSEPTPGASGSSAPASTPASSETNAPAPAPEPSSSLTSTDASTSPGSTAASSPSTESVATVGHPLGRSFAVSALARLQTEPDEPDVVQANSKRYITARECRTEFPKARQAGKEWYVKKITSRSAACSLSRTSSRRQSAGYRPSLSWQSG